MKTIRRLYFYLVALISLEVVIWGLINLIRTMFSAGLTFPGADTLAQALALILVGVPIFAVHWLWAQNTSARDAEEHGSSLRAIFLYAVLLFTLIPALQNLLALINRTFIVTAGIDSGRSFLGGTQSWIDNAIAIVLNLVAAAYFYNVLNLNWATLKDSENFADVRRLYRYIWVLYPLLMTVFGVQQILRFVFTQTNLSIGINGKEVVVNGLALILIGTPVWVFAWNLCQKALQEPRERSSSLRLGVLYLLALAGVVTVLTSSGLMINTLLMRLFGEVLPWQVVISKIGVPFSVGLPMAIIWAYYGSWLGKEFASVEDETRRAGLRRIYFYVLSLIGLVATFTGLALLLSFIVSSLTSNALWGEVLRPRISGAIATLLAGLPLWLAVWRPLQIEAHAMGDMGDHARRSLVRRSYLYLAIFATVIGGMASAINLVYTLLFGFLDHRTSSFLTDVFNGLQLLLLFTAFLLYHWYVLRKDGEQAASALAVRQEHFAVLIFESQDSGFAAPIRDAIKRASLFIPVAIQPVEQGIPEETAAVQAVILPSSLALDPPEALRLWLKEYQGARVFVPLNTDQETSAQRWYWTGIQSKNGSTATAQIIRLLAEGQQVRNTNSSPAWQMVAYIFAILFGLQLLFMLFGLGLSMIVG
jgi:hypothetical protein